MGNIKNVYCPKKEEVIQIDASKEKDWMSKYWHWSGKPFEGQEVVVEEDYVAETVVDDPREVYLEVYGKEVPNNKKNDEEWIWKKIKEVIYL